MKTSTGPRPAATGAFVFLLAARAFAQDERVRIAASGRVELTAVSRDGAINEASVWTPGGLAAGSPLRDHDTFFMPVLSLRFDVEGPAWSAAVEAGNAGIEFDSPDPRLQNDRLGEAEAMDVDLLEAWLELLGALRFGAQRLEWDPTGRGHPLFLAPSRAESPWDELPDSTMPPFPAFSTNTVPQTRRDTRHPLGLTGRFGELAFFALLVGEGGAVRSDETLAGGTATLSLGELHLSAVVAHLAGGGAFGGARERVWTAGAAANLESPPFYLATEVYVQYGTAGRTDTDGDGTPETLSARGSAGRVAARYADGFWIQGAIVYSSGDRRATDRREGRFLSYEDNDATLILEGNEFGLDIDTNYWSVQLSGGFEATLCGKPVRPRAVVAFSRFLEKVPLPPDPAFGVSGRSRELGTEGDLIVDVEWTSGTTLWVGGAVLLRSGALEEFTSDRTEAAALFAGGMAVRF